MKKSILLIFCVLLLTGCGKQVEDKKEEVKTGTIKCSLSSKDVVNGYSLEAEYNINYKGEIVESVKTTETVLTTKKNLLNQFEKTFNDTYKAVSDAYGGYDYKVTKEKDKVISVVTIDYNKMNLEQFVKDQPTLKDYVEGGKLKVTGLEELYKAAGATCE